MRPHNALVTCSAARLKSKPLCTMSAPTSCFTGFGKELEKRTTASEEGSQQQPSPLVCLPTDCPTKPACKEPLNFRSYPSGHGNSTNNLETGISNRGGRRSTQPWRFEKKRDTRSHMNQHVGHCAGTLVFTPLSNLTV